ncbi:MAG TPA: hypothetical protein PLS49_01065 [Candidatus Woesebacteria bacterium]|nr:hypothetical protein [Candidatus Woesebacteria bacterium]
MPKGIITGYYIVSLEPEDGDGYISKIATDGLRTVFEATLSAETNIVTVDGKEDENSVRSSLMPLLDMLKVVYPEQFIQDT